MEDLLWLIPALPFAGALLLILAGTRMRRPLVSFIGVGSVALSALITILLGLGFIDQPPPYIHQLAWQWFEVAGFRPAVAFHLDALSLVFLFVITFVGLLIHLYSTAYMAQDKGYARFFAYMNLFVGSMLVLVLADNLLLLYLGWEGVGLCSYLLIGFWYKKPTAVFANLKAFLVNRVGDFGFLLGIAGVLLMFGSLDYATVFANAPAIEGMTMSIIAGQEWSVATVICICLFIGAMGKSAQVPLHVWLPDSMEGPTPISALIHAATMVTAGIFMVARMSPLFELSQTALNFILFIGATTAFWTGLIGIVQNDIKRVVAYSTLSQLGYMTVALGVSAYSAGVYHLMTHAFFKALLFLGAGSVIIAMHHEQDMRRMGGLKKYMPITYWTMLLGTLALVATPFFSGYYSKDVIIEATHLAAASDRAGWIGHYAYWAVLLGAFVTAFYSFRLLFMTFHGKERFRDAHADGHAAHDDGHGHHGVHEPHESPWVVTVPLVLLAIPSVLIGFFTAGPMLFGTDWSGHVEQLPFFLGAIEVNPVRDVMATLKAELWHGPVELALHAVKAPSFWLTVAGFVLALVMYWWKPELATRARNTFAWPVRVLENKYGFDALWIDGFAGGSLRLGKASRAVDTHVIDGIAVNGSAQAVGLVARLARQVQSGFLYHYAFAMILGLIVLMAVLISTLN